MTYDIKQVVSTNTRGNMKKFSVYTAALVALILFPNFIGVQTLTWDETKADTIENNIGDAATPQIATSGDTVVAVWQ